VLAIRGGDEPDNAAFVYMGELHEAARQSARVLRWVQVFLVFGDESLNDVLNRARPLGRITYPDMFGALVSCTGRADRSRRARSLHSDRSSTMARTEPSMSGDRSAATRRADRSVCRPTVHRS